MVRARTGVKVNEIGRSDGDGVESTIALNLPENGKTVLGDFEDFDGAGADEDLAG